MPDAMSRKFDIHDSQRPRLKYEQLKGHLLTELRSGRLKPGDALPTEVELAEMLSVARNTVRHALSELDRDGFIRRIRGKGTFVSEVVSAPLKTELGLFSLVVPESEGGHYPSMIQGFSRAATEHHTHAIVNDTDNDVNKQAAVILQLLSKRAGGVALVPTLDPTPANQITLLQQQGIPVVQCHRPVEGVDAPLLAIHQREINRLAGERLIEAGHRRVAWFDSTWGPGSDALLDQIRKTMSKAGGEVRDEDIFIGSGSVVHMYEQEGRIEEALQKMFDRPDPPTAIATSFDTVAEVVFLVLQRMGLRVPEDVSLMGFGGRERSGAVIGRLTSVVMDGAEVGRMAYDMLDEMREGKRPIHDTQRVDIPLGFYEGQTLGAPKQG